MMPAALTGAHALCSPGAGAPQPFSSPIDTATWTIPLRIAA
jgi:hypothetical protein